MSLIFEFINVAFLVGIFAFAAFYAYLFFVEALKEYHYAKAHTLKHYTRYSYKWERRRLIQTGACLLIAVYFMFLFAILFINYLDKVLS